MELSMTPVRSHLIHQLRADIRVATGRHYNIDWEGIDELSLREMMRLLIDLKFEHQRALNNERMRARRTPWLVK
jgi:hypothetical protein